MLLCQEKQVSTPASIHRDVFKGILTHYYPQLVIFKLVLLKYFQTILLSSEPSSVFPLFPPEKHITWKASYQPTFNNS